MSVFREQDIEVSADLVRDCPGLSMDVGGSVAKIVYRTKQEWEALQKNKGAKSGKLRLLSCPRTELTAAIERIQADGYITRREDGKPTEIFTCGIGCSQFGPRINKMLNVKLSNVIEMDCFIKAFIYLVDRYSFKILIHPLCQDVVDDVAKEWKQMQEMMEGMTKMTAMKLGSVETEATQENTEKPDDEPEKVDLYSMDSPISQALGDDMYPCMLAMLGSAFAFMKIEKDGTFSVPDGSNRGGRTLLGLGALLLSAQSYDEIIDLAEKGDALVVTTSHKQFQKESKGDSGETQEEGIDVYAQFMTDDQPERAALYFGNAIGKTLSDFSRENLATSLVAFSVNDTAQTLYKTCEASGVRRCFVSGSYANREFIRRQFTFDWEQASSQRAMLGQGTNKIELHFLAQGSHLGALGALINTVEKFIDKEGNVGNGNECKGIVEAGNSE